MGKVPRWREPLFYSDWTEVVVRSLNRTKTILSLVVIERGWKDYPRNSCAQGGPGGAYKDDPRQGRGVDLHQGSHSGALIAWRDRVLKVRACGMYSGRHTSRVGEA